MLAPKVQPAHHPPVSMAAQRGERDRDRQPRVTSPPAPSQLLLRAFRHSLSIIFLSAELLLFPLEPRRTPDSTASPCQQMHILLMHRAQGVAGKC